MGKLQLPLLRHTKPLIFSQYKLTHPTRCRVFKVSEIEKDTLTTFLDLFDTFIYTCFLNRWSAGVLLEDIIDIERDEISGLLIGLWDVLCRVIENYDRYLSIKGSIDEDYIFPAGREVNSLLDLHIGTRYEERMRIMMEEGLDSYENTDLSVLRREDGLFP